MKIVTERSALLKAIAHVQSVVEKRGTIPILANIKLEAANNQLCLTATDMDIAIVEYAPATIGEAGNTTVSAQMFYEIVKKLQEGSQVELIKAADATKLVIKSGTSKFSLATLPVDEFPVMTAGDFSHSFTITASECKALIDKTSFAVANDGNRYYLGGIYLHAADNQGMGVLRTVATDGHRLARVEVALPAGAAGMTGALIPRKTIGEIRRLSEEGATHVEISVSENKIKIVFGTAILISKLVDATYPDYERVIPTANDKIMEVDVNAFKKAVERVSIVSAEKTRGIQLSFVQGKLTLSADSQEFGAATEEVEINYAAEQIDIGFNSRYLLELLAQIEGETVQFIFADGSSPALVRDTADVGSLYVLMPMRV